MTIWAIVPVKPIQRANSRLAKVLNRVERADLSRQLLQHTLKTLAEVSQVERTLVISRDSEALAIARDHGARTVAEWGNPQLNNALVRASLVARGYGISAVLVLPADLPLLSRQDIEKLISLSGNPPEVILAPDRRETGTNAILSSPPGLIDYDFGPDSFQQHIKRAKAAGARVEICQLPSLELDLDVPDDLEALEKALGELDFRPEKE
jgi:2-phospho-L-lactate guanylyltransferase